MASIRKRIRKSGISYQARVRLNGHPAIAREFRSHISAKRWSEKAELELREGRVIADAEKRTLADAIDRYLDEHLSRYPKRLEARRYQLLWWKQQIGHLRLSRITSPILGEARGKLLKEPGRHGKLRSGASVNRTVAALSHVLSYAQSEWGWISQNPARGLRAYPEKSRLRYLSDDERAALLRECAASNNKFLYLIVLIALTSGARKSEILNLTWDDVVFSENSAQLIFRKTKNNHPRSVSIFGEPFRKLSEHSKIRRLDTRLLFPGENPQKPIEIPKAWEYALKRANISNFRFHDLRHCTASYLAMMGQPARFIAEVLGHRTSAMAERYSHLSESYVNDGMEKYSERYFG